LNLVINNLPIPIEKDGMAEYVKAAAQKLKTGESEISIAEILSKALDLSCKEQFLYKVSLVVTIDDSYENRQAFSAYQEPIPVQRKTVCRPSSLLSTG